MYYQLKDGDLMYEAASKNDLELLEEILNNDLFVPCNQDLDDCLMRACKCGSTEIVKRILKVKPETGWYHYTENAHHETPLMIAVVQSYPDIVEILLDAGADINDQNDKGRTPLHLAVYNRDYILTKRLLGRNCDTNIHDMWGDTALLLCARRGFTDILRVLLRSGCDLRDYSTEHDTCLHYAASLGHCKVLNFLIDKGADLEARNVWEYTPLMLAVQNSQTETSLILIERGSNIHSTDRSGRSALFYCVKKDMTTVIHQLLLKGASPDVVDEDGNTPMHEAIYHNDIETIKMFIQFNANVNIVGKSTIRGEYRHCTPLEVAMIQNNNMAAAILLISAGCDTVRVKNILKDCDLSDDILYNDAFITWLEDVANGPPKLSYLARMKIRKTIKGNVVPGIEQLPVPPMVKNYLSFHDVFETMEFFHYR